MIDRIQQIEEAAAQAVDRAGSSEELERVRIEYLGRKAELPQLKASYATYKNNPNVVFLLVSIDEDTHRLQRFLNEMKFPFPVARAKPEQMEKAMGFDNVPATFYVDKSGMVRYQVIGTEMHGDSPTRVSWYVDQLLK